MSMKHIQCCDVCGMVADVGRGSWDMLPSGRMSFRLYKVVSQAILDYLRLILTLK
jgi:hypothetical protein